MPRKLDIIRRLQDRLLEIVRAVLPLMTGSIADADLPGITHLRGEMIEAIDAYCRHIHAVRDAALRQRDVAALAQIEPLVSGCVSLRAAYDAFRNRWAGRTAEGNWHEYRLSAIVMMKQIRDQVQHAEALRSPSRAAA